MRNKPSVTVERLKRLVPAPIKRGVKEALRERRFRRAWRRITQLPEGQLPTSELLNELQIGWGNDSFAARTDYLQEIIKRAAETRGPILECGSGLTSLLLGLYAGRRGVQTYSLEHMPEWRDRVTLALRRHRIPGVEICLSPLREYDDFSWYDAPLESLPESLSLVVCDGPPGTTRGGRYGLIPVLETRLSSQAVILLDDVDRESETHVLRRWVSEKNVRVTLRTAPTGAFALITR